MTDEIFTVHFPISAAMADVAGAPQSVIEKIVRTVGTPGSRSGFVCTTPSTPPVADDVSESGEAKPVAWMIPDWGAVYGKAGYRYLTSEQAQTSRDDWEDGEHDAFQSAMKAAVPLYASPSPQHIGDAGGADYPRVDGKIAPPVEIGYTNYRGEFAVRCILPLAFWYGSTDWHPEPQWLVKAYDADKGAERDFAFKDFGAAALPPARVEAGDGWQPIETAPKDGRQIVVGFANNPRTGSFLASTAEWSVAFETWDCDGWTAGKLADDMGISPTHWRPLPAPPALQSEQPK